MIFLSFRRILKMNEQLPYSERLRLIKLGLLPKEAVAKPKKAIKRVSDKKAAALAAEKEGRNGEETDLVKWFKNQMKFMPQYCEETGQPLETKIYKFAICSICHILPKESCKSVKLHPLNRMFYHPDFHTKFDAMSWEEREQLKSWPIIRQRLISIEPDLSPEEKRRLPESLNYLFDLPF